MKNRLNISPIVNKELKSYFNSPIAYIIMVVFLFFTSFMLFFLQDFFGNNIASLRAYFSTMQFAFIVVIPAITMRLWAEEKKMKSDEILSTLPFRNYELVLGKFLSAFILFLIMIAITTILPIMVSFAGDFEAGEVITQYIGIILFGAFCLSIGLFVSSITNNQIIAFLISVFILVLLIVMGYLSIKINFPRPVAVVINSICMPYHFESFNKGLLDSRDILYFILGTIFFLYLNIKVLIFKKWN